MRHHKILFYLLFLKKLWRCHTDLELVDESLNIFSLRQLAFETSFDFSFQQPSPRNIFKQVDTFKGRILSVDFKGSKVGTP